MTTISTPAEQVPASAPPAPRPDVNRKRMARLGWSFSAPALILIAAVTIFPIVYSVVMSLSNVTVTTASAAGPLRIVGLDRDTAQRLVDELASTSGLAQGDAT